MTLNEILERSDVYLTLTNEQGEILSVGSPDYVKPLSSKTVMRWKTDGKYENIFPFTHAVLHDTTKVLNVKYIKPILPGTETVLELEYVNG